MAEANYAFIKNDTVVNIAVFDNPDDNLLDHFIKEFDLDKIVLANERTVVGGTFDGILYWPPQPYPSWIKGKFDWEPPISYPEIFNENEYYVWNENSMSWVLISPSN